jgi:putative hemolysin
LQCTENTIFVVARPLLFFVRLLRPFIALMNGLGNAFVRVLSLQATSEQANMHSIEELEILVLDVQEATLLHRVFDFGDKTVQQVMMPRTEIVGVAVSSSLEQVQVVFAQEQYTRLLIYMQAWRISSVWCISRSSSHGRAHQVD